MENLPEPLVPPEVDLRGFAFMPIDIVRLFGSRFHAIADDSQWRAGFTLWLKSWHQVPAGSLPDDDVELSRLAELGRDIKGWRKLRGVAMHGWVKCSDGRLYHATVAEKAMLAWTRHHRLRNAATRLIRPKRIKGGRWEKLRAAVFERDGWVCVACGSRDVLEVDHIKPLAAGGTHDIRNLQCLCRPCNRRKSFKVAA